MEIYYQYKQEHKKNITCWLIAPQIYNLSTTNAEQEITIQSTSSEPHRHITRDKAKTPLIRYAHKHENKKNFKNIACGSLHTQKKAINHFASYFFLAQPPVAGWIIYQSH